MPPTSRRRRGVVVVGTWLVSHAYPPYIQYMTTKTNPALATPTKDRSCSISAVSWVIVKTNTRSKNSSSVDTRSSPCSLGVLTYGLPLQRQRLPGVMMPLHLSVVGAAGSGDLEYMPIG